MTMQVEPIRVVGIKEALAELNSIDKRFRRGLTGEYKTIVHPMVAEAQSLVPLQAPMSGWNREWTPRSWTVGARGGYKEQYDLLLPWTGFATQRSIKPFLSGKKPRSYGGTTRSIAAMGMRWLSKEAVLFDQSGQARTPQGEQMLDTLGQRFGPPSRVMWRAYEQTSLDIQYELRQFVEKIMNAVGRKVKVG